MIRILIAALLVITPAQAHDIYHDWVNGNAINCCHDRDCKPIPDSSERILGGNLHVLVEGTWCPILSHHYLKSGNAPDHSTAHVCVRPGIGNPCQRLLCYQPRPLS